MKKILYIVLLLIGCISCDSFVEDCDRREQELRQQRIEEHITDTTYLEENLRNVKFDGHLYVVYTERFGVAMVHSPNCKCNE